MAESLELPRPARLLRSSASSLTASAGLPIAALVLAAWLWGRNAGLVAALAAVWITLAVRKIRTGPVPNLLTISTIVLTLQTAAAIGTGQLWIFLLHFQSANLALRTLLPRPAPGPPPL